MERSKPALVDVTLTINLSDYGPKHLSVDGAIVLLAGYTRLRSLHLTGEHGILCTVLDVLRTATPTRTLFKILHSCRPPYDLLGGQAPIREMISFADSKIVAPHGFLVVPPTSYLINRLRSQISLVL
jgi:hypothetical protein